MRVGSRRQFHLTYCTNIHPGDRWSDVMANLETYVLPLKHQISPNQQFGIGLRLADIASRQLLESNQLNEFQEWLQHHNLYVFTINGFPYGGFHQQVVKDQVYSPDWSTPKRLDYTRRLVHILATLLPANVDGSISTVPLSYKPWWSRDRLAPIVQACVMNLATLALELVRLRQITGQSIHVDLEPEPDGLLENSAEVVDFFQRWLLPIGGAWLANQLDCSQQTAEIHLLEHIQICYDTCHFAVAYEVPDRAIQILTREGIRIGKVQLSSALQVPIPADSTQRSAIAHQLSAFAESTYLHQVVTRSPNGVIHNYRDLAQALPKLLHTSANEWRVHFHVPIFLESYSQLHSTQSHLKAFLQEAQEHPISHHLEIETYTWDVLPDAMKTDVLTSIHREYQWVLTELCNEPSFSMLLD